MLLFLQLLTITSIAPPAIASYLLHLQNQSNQHDYRLFQVLHFLLNKSHHIYHLHQHTVKVVFDFEHLFDDNLMPTLQERAPERKIALVTGGNRGLGYETCKQLAKLGLTVLLGARDLTKGKSAAYQLNEKEGLDVTFCQLDVSNQKSYDESK
jgi:hypothetical protein